MRLLLAAAILSLTPLPSWADDSWGFGGDETAGLRALLDRLPAALVQTVDNRADIGFGDLAAARAVVGPVPVGRRSAGLRAAARAMPPGPVSQLVGYGPDLWRAAVGFAIDDVDRLLLFDMPPLSAGVWELAPGVAAGVPEVLRAQGYADAEQGGLSAFAYGEDQRIDIAGRVRGDPFRGELGRSARVSLAGDVLRHASTWPLMAALAGATRAPASEAPPLAQMLDRLDGLDRGALLRAQVVPDISGILAGDPLAALTGGAAGGAAARWESMLLADFSTGAESTAVLVLSVHWPDDAALEPLAQSVATLWQARASASGRTFAERLGAPVTVDATRVSGGRALLRLSVTVPTTESVADLPVNRAFEILLSAYAMRDMTFLP